MLSCWPFWLFLQVSELVGERSGTGFGRPGLQLGDIQLEHKMQVHISESKTDQNNKGSALVVHPVIEHPKMCNIRAMPDYLLHKPKSSASLFIRFSGSPKYQYQFQAVLSWTAAAPTWHIKGFTTHSFCIGATTTAAINRVHKNQIMLKG